MSYMNANTITKITEYNRKVDTIVEAGGKVSAKHLAVRDRWHAWAEPGASAAHALEEAWDQNAPQGALETLRIAHLISQAVTPVMEAETRNLLAPRAYGDLVQTYAPQAPGNYDRVRAAWQEQATTLTRLAATVNLEEDAAALVSADDTQRHAWLEAAVVAARLDTLASVLFDAATLAGHPVTTDGDKIGALITTNGAHRRRVFEAFNSNGRCGKWSALIALGCDLDAKGLDALTTYREPRPMETRQEHTGIGVRQYQADPEDEDYQPTATSRVTMI